MATSARETADSTIDKAAPRRHWIPIAVLLLLCLVGVSFVRDQRRLARNAQCRGKLGQIRLALQNYQHEHGGLPPLVVRDDREKAVMSWRVCLLPYLDEGKAFSELDLSEPWNGTKNATVANRVSCRIVKSFQSPNDFDRNRDDTSFIALDMPESADCARRLVIIEIHNTGIHWMEPRDLTQAEIRSRVNDMIMRGESVHVLTANGQVGTLAGNSLTFFGWSDDLFTQWAAPEVADSNASRDAAGEVQKFDDGRKITRQFAETVALDNVGGRTGPNRDRLTASAVRHDKYWHKPEGGGDAVLISGWSVTVWRKPATPGGHYTLFVADDGTVKDFRGGK